MRAPSQPPELLAARRQSPWLLLFLSDVLSSYGLWRRTTAADAIAVAIHNAAKAKARTRAAAAVAVAAVDKTAAAAVEVAADTGAEAAAGPIPTPTAAAGDAAATSRTNATTRTSPRITATAWPSPPAPACWKCTPTATASSADPTNNFTRERTDPFVPGTMIEKFGLREGVLLTGMVQHHRRGSRARGSRRSLDVDGMPPDDYLNVKTFDDLTPINPEKWLRLETGPEPLTHARDGPAHAAGQGPAGADRRPAANRQDDPAAAHQPGDFRPTIPT